MNKRQIRCTIALIKQDHIGKNIDFLFQFFCSITDNFVTNLTEKSVEVFQKQTRAATEHQKCGLFKTLPQDAIKDHKLKRLELNQHFEKT